jgi:orotate phosphoribosyltransferase-like protein
MSKMSELALQVEELVEQGMSAKFIAVTMNIPYEWAEQAVKERNELEKQKQQEVMSYEDQ